VAEFQRAQSLLGTDRNASIDILHSIVKRDIQDSDEEAVRVKEQSILELGGLLAKTGQAAGKNIWKRQMKGNVPGASREVGCRGFAGCSLCKVLNQLGLTGVARKSAFWSVGEATEK
uniref:CARD domain-containing protein n=1 Tax=Astatotilapia calliptera TaxID=8154 RepID=A0AAX7VQL3_ASTCA